MKNTLVFFTLLMVFISSCTNVYFDQPQPKNGEILKFVPLELRGTWIEKLDTLYITKHGFEEVNVKTDSFGTIASIKRETHILSDSLMLQKAGKYYVVNIREKKNWQVVILDRQNNGDIIWYYPFSPPFFGEGNGLKVKKVKGNINGVEIIDKSLTNKDKGSISSVYYQGQFRSEDIKKILIEENKLWIFKADGTIFEPKK